MAALPENDRIAGPFVAEPGQTDFPADFPLIKAEGLRVRRDRAGVTTVLEPPAVSAVNATEGSFTARLAAGAQVGDRLFVFSELPPARLRRHTPNGSVRTQTLEGDAEEFQAQLQELRRDLGGAVRRLPGSPPISPEDVLAAAEAVAGRARVDGGNVEAHAFRQAIAAVEQVSPQRFGGQTAPAINLAALQAEAGDGSGLLHLPAGSYSASAPINLAGYSHVQGDGNRTVVSLSSGASINYTHAAALPVFDDHSHKALSGLRVIGDGGVVANVGQGNGTTKGYHHNSSVSSRPFVQLTGNVFQDHNIGVHYDHTYIQSGYANHYMRNRIGLCIDSSNLTAEYSSYFRRNTEAAIDIKSASQDAIFIACGIEGNPGRAVRIAADVPAFARYTWQNCYFELNGNFDTGVPAFENLSTNRIVLEFRNCNLWYNEQGVWKTGIYRLGKAAVLSNCRVEGRFEVEQVAITDGTYLGNASFNGAYSDLVAQQPTHLVEWDVVTFTGGLGGLAGYLFQLTSAGGKPGKSPVANSAPRNYPHVTSASAGVTISEDTASDYGEGSFTRLAFGSAAGGFSANFAELATHSDGAKPYRVNVFYVKAAVDTAIGLVQSGGAQNLQKKVALSAGKLYKLMTLTGRAAPGTTYLRMFPIGTDAPTVSVLPLWSASFADLAEASRFIKAVVAGDGGGVVRGPSAYTVSNVTVDRSFDADAGALVAGAAYSQGQMQTLSNATSELADVLGTLLADLKTAGVLP